MTDENPTVPPTEEPAAPPAPEMPASEPMPAPAAPEMPQAPAPETPAQQSPPAPASGAPVPPPPAPPGYQPPPSGYATPGQPTAPAAYQPPPPGYAPQQPGAQQSPFGGEKNKLVAGILAILLGSLGIHKFYLGYTTAGIIMLVVTIVGSFLFGLGPLVMWVIGVIEGILYLTKSDQEFYNVYVVGQKPWF